MQNLSVTVLPGFVPVQVTADGIASIAAGDAADSLDFNALLENQIEALAAAPEDEAALPAGQQVLEAKPEASGEPDSSDAPAMPADLVAWLGGLVQTAPTQALPAQGAEAQATPSAGLSISTKSDGSAASVLNGARDGSKTVSLPVLPNDIDPTSGELLMEGEVAAEIAGTGKNLPPLGVELMKAAAQAGEQVKLPEGSARPGMDTLLARMDMPAHAASVHAGAHRPEALALEPRVGTPAWDGALGQKVVWMASQHQQSAEMQLNPPQLGPLEVKLTVANDQATAMFVSHHAAVRDAIESALPRLREMLAESGITLGNVQVSAESFQREQGFGDNREQASRQAGGLDPLMQGADEHRVGVMRLPARGLVDTFA